MGHLLCKFRPPPRRRPLPGRCRPLVSPACSASHPVRHHPAAPAPSHCPGHRPFHRDRDRRPLPASFRVEPKRPYPLPPAVGSPVGLLPSVNWRDPPKKPVLSARTSITFGPSRTVRIPPPRQKFTVLRSLPEQTVEAVKPTPSSYLPRSCPKGLGEKAQEVPREGKEHLVETRGQDDGNRAPHGSGDRLLTSRPLETGGLLSSDQRSPAPADQSPSPSGDSLGENTQIPRVSSPSERPAVTSEGPAGDVVPLREPDTEAAVLSDPTPSCPLLQEGLTQEGVAENHQPLLSTPHLSTEVREADKPSGIPSGHSVPPVSATSRPSKRKRSMPLFVPLPSAMPLQWGRGELPPPPKLPCIAIDKDLGIWGNTEGQGKVVSEGGAEILADDGATPPAPSSPLLASKTTDSLPPAVHTSQVPVPTTDLAGQSARPPIPSVPPPSPTENTDQETGAVAPNSPTLAVPAASPPPGETPPKNEDPPPPAIDITPPSDPLTPPNTSTISSQLPSCKGESPTPMCVDPPPLLPPTPLPVPSPNTPVIVVVAVATRPVSSAVAARASANVTPGHSSNSDVTDMDTTPPSQAITFRSAPGPGVSSPSLSQGHCNRVPKRPGKTLASTVPSKRMATGPNVTPQPTQGTLAGQQRTAVLPSAGISTGLLAKSGATTVPVGSTSANRSHCSNPDAMDTTPPSRAVLFHSLPQSKANHLPSYNTPPSSSTAVAHHSTHVMAAKSAIIPIAIAKHSAPGIPSQPVSGNQSGQQPGKSYPLGKPVAPTQATGPTASTAQPPKDGRKQSGLAASAFGTTVKKQKAVGYKTGILPDGISTASGRAVAAGILSARVSSSLITLTTLAPHVLTGPAAPMDGGSFGFGVSTAGPAHPQQPGTSNLGAGLQGAPSTTSAPPFGQTTQALSQTNMAAAAGGASTVPVFGQASNSTLNPATWGQPAQNVRGAVVGNHNTAATVGGAGGPSTLNCTQGSSKQRKSSPGGKPTGKGKRHGSKDMSTSTLNQSPKSQPAQSRGGPRMGKNNTAPTIRGCSVPVTFKCSLGSSKQRKPGERASTSQRKPGERASTSEKGNMSGDLCVSPLNPRTRGRPAETTGSTTMGRDDAAPTIAASGVPTTKKGTQGTPKQKHPALGGKAPAKGARNVSKTVCVSPLPNTGGSPGHTTTVVIPSASTNSALQPTTSSLFPPSTCGAPAQNTGGLKEGNTVTPKTGKPGIPALHQYNSGPPDANAGGTDVDDIVAMMAALHISERPQKTSRLPSTDTGGAMGISTTPTKTGNTKGPPPTQTTRSAPHHSTDGAMGGSAVQL